MRKNSVKNRIYNYAGNKSYFSISDLQKHLERNNVVFSDENLKKSLYRMRKEKILFISSEKDFLESLRDGLENHSYNVFINPLKSEAEKFFHIKDQTAILRPSLTKGEPKDGHFAKIEKIIVDLHMETKKVNLMDREEYKRIISNIFNNFRINVADMLEYAERRGIRDSIANFVH